MFAGSVGNSHTVIYLLFSFFVLTSKNTSHSIAIMRKCLKNSKQNQDRIRLLEKEVASLRQACKRLQKTQSIQDALLEKSLAGYYVISAGKICFVNSAMLTYTGYSRDELIGKDTDSLIHPEDKRTVKKKVRAMLHGELTSPYEYRIITKNHEILWIMEAVTSISFAGRRSVLGNSVDITRLKSMERKLLESENLYRAIFETTGTATAIIEEDKTVSMVNSEFERLTGYCKKDWEGKKKWTELADPRDVPRMKKYHRLRRIDPGSVPRSYEYHLIDSRGNVKNVLTTADVIPGTKKHISSFVDITALKEKEKELIDKSQSLVELNVALKVVLKQREEDRVELQKALLSNIKLLVMPNIDKLRKSNLDDKIMVYVELLASNLENSLSPFSHKLSANLMNLTPTQIQVVNLIKDGKSSKQIADLLNLSPGTIDVYRYRIRAKLGLDRKANLRSYLAGLS